MNTANRHEKIIPFFGAVSSRHLSVAFMILVSAGYALLSVSSRESMTLPEIIGGIIVVTTVYVANRLPQ